MSSELNKTTTKSLFKKGLAKNITTNYGACNDRWELTQLGFDEINKMLKNK